MKKLLYPSAILCAFYCATLVKPVYAAPVTSSDLTVAWGVYAPGGRPRQIPKVQIDVSFKCSNPNDTAQSFSKDLTLCSGFEPNISYDSSATRTAVVDANAIDEALSYQTFIGAGYPGANSQWTLYFDLPGDNPNNFPNYSPRSSTHQYPNVNP